MPQKQFELAQKIIIENGFENHISIDFDSENEENSKKSIFKIIKIGVLFLVIATFVFLITVIWDIFG